MPKKGRPKTAEVIKLNRTAADKPARQSDPDYKPQRRTPRLPASLRDDRPGRLMFKWLARRLIKQRILAEVDVYMLESAAIVYSRFLRAHTQVMEMGEVVETVAGNIIQNPYLAVENKAWLQLTTALASLGLSPTDRSRVTKTAATEEDLFS